MSRGVFPSRAPLTTLRTRLYLRLRGRAHVADAGAEPATAAAVGPTARLANTYSDSIAVADGHNLRVSRVCRPHHRGGPHEKQGTGEARISYRSYWKPTEWFTATGTRDRLGRSAHAGRRSR